MAKTKVLLIEDSGLMRLMISDILNSDPDVEVLDTAENGKIGVEKTLKLNPDVVVSDFLMPDYDGLYVVKRLMKEKPVPVVLLSSLNRSDSQVFDALNAGAYDFIDKPKEKVIAKLREVNIELLRAVKSAAGVDMSTLQQAKNVKKVTHEHTFSSEVNYDIIAIGASTGGPSAIEAVLQKIPSNLFIPVVIVQHMPSRFIETFTKRLAKLSPLPVRVAQRNKKIIGGNVYIVPGDSNTEIIKDPNTGDIVFARSRKSFQEYNNPSIDCLLSSVAKVYGKRSIGVILTGMGKDGTAGMKQIYDQGGYTVAQDEATSIVFGMPKNAIESNVTKQVVPLKEIPGFLMSCLS